MKVAVTGGTGVVGSPVIRHLVEGGHEVVALARTEATATELRASGATPVGGDVLDTGSLGVLFGGVDLVFHVAGVNEMCSRDPDRMDMVNIEGTRNVMHAARRAGVRRLVHTSSASTLGEARGEVANESTPHRGWYLSRYERSKHISEQVLFEEAGDLAVVAVNPSSVQGPGRATGTGKLLLDVLNGRLPVLVDATVSIVDIDDCARGHLLAAERGVSGQRYVLSGATIDLSDALAMLAEMTGRRLQPRFVPGWVASVGAGLVELGSAVLGRHPKVCREMVNVLRVGHAYDGSRAQRELGLEYTPIESTMRRTVEWAQSQGMLSI